MQGLRILRNEAYLQYAAMTKDEAERSSWTFYEAVNVCKYNGSGHVRSLKQYAKEHAHEPQAHVPLLRH